MNVTLFLHSRRLFRRPTSYSLGASLFDRRSHSFRGFIAFSRQCLLANCSVFSRPNFHTWNWYTSSCQRHAYRDDNNVIASSLSPRALRSMLIEAVEQPKERKWDALLQQAVSLGNDGAYIIEELLSKVMQRNDLTSMHDIVKAVSKFQFQLETPDDNSSRNLGGDIISIPLLSAVAACAADHAYWPMLKDTTKLLLFSSEQSSTSSGSGRNVDIPERLLARLFEGLMTSDNGTVEVLDLLSFIMKQKRDDVITCESICVIPSSAFSIAVSLPALLHSKKKIQEALFNAMEIWLRRCRVDGVMSIAIAKYIVAIALHANCDALTGEFVRNSLIAAQKQYYLKNSFLPDKHFSLRNWADNPLSLWHEYTICLDQITSKQPYYSSVAVPESSKSINSNYDALLSEVNFELLQQAFPMFEQTVFRGSIDNNGNAESKVNSNKLLEKSEFSANYWHLEYLLRDASFVKPNFATRSFSAATASAVADVKPPVSNNERLDNANETINNLYEQLKMFANDSSNHEIEIRVRNGYSRRLLRYLCDAFDLHHAPVYTSGRILSVREDSDEEDDALQRSKSNDRIRGVSITRMRISKVFQKKYEEKNSDNIELNEIGHFLKDSIQEEHIRRRKQLPQYINNFCPSLEELMRKDRELNRLNAMPLFWPEFYSLLQRSSDKELHHIVQGQMNIVSKGTGVSWLLLVAEYVSNTRNMPLPNNFFSQTLTMCHRSRDLYGLLEVVYLAEHEYRKNKRDPVYRRKRYQLKEGNVRGFSLTDTKWTHIMDTAVKSVKFLTSRNSLHTTILEILSLQQQQRKLSASTVKNLLVVFSTFIERDSQLIPKVIEENLNSSISGNFPSYKVDQIEIIALTNYLLLKLKHIAIAMYQGYHHTVLIHMNRPVFKQRDYLRIKPDHAQKIIGEFLVSTVPKPDDRYEFNHLWLQLSTATGKVALLDYVTRHIDKYSFASLCKEEDALISTAIEASNASKAVQQYKNDLHAFVAQTRMLLMVIYLLITPHNDAPNTIGGVEDIADKNEEEDEDGSNDSQKSISDKVGTGNALVKATQLLLRLVHTEQALMHVDSSLLEEIKRDRDRRIQRSKKPRLDYNQARSM